MDKIMAEGFEIFQNVLNYKQQNDLAIHGRSGLFECRSGSRDFCAPGIVWIMLMLLPVILPVIVGAVFVTHLLSEHPVTVTKTSVKISM